MHRLLSLIYSISITYMCDYCKISYNKPLKINETSYTAKHRMLISFLND